MSILWKIYLVRGLRDTRGSGYGGQSYHETGIGSSRRYIVDTVSLGVAPRPTVTESNAGPIAPNEYSLDGPEAAKVIFRTRNHLEKVNR